MKKNRMTCTEEERRINMKNAQTNNMKNAQTNNMKNAQTNNTHNECCRQE